MRICDFCIYTYLFNCKMSGIEEFLSVVYKCAAARKGLDKPTFETLVFRFVEISSGLTSQSKKVDYERALEQFRVQYFNEFMYKCNIRSEECEQFIKTLADFSEKKRPQKKNYQQLFRELGCYEKSEGTRNSLLAMEKLINDFCAAAPNLEVPLSVKEYINEISYVVTALAESPKEIIYRLKMEHDEATRSMASENKSLLAETSKLRTEMADLKVVQVHIVADNEDLRISMQNINEDRSITARKFRQCESAFYELRERHETILRETTELKRRLDESIRQQWSYYNGLKQHGIVN